LEGIIVKKFVRPLFDGKSVELRYTDGEVCIYGTPEGLTKLSDLCLRLAGLPPDQGTDHTHLEDYDILTADSLRGTIAVFAGT
jgi:hypothetical protein